jgi:hypothetical protein
MILRLLYVFLGLSISISGFTQTLSISSTGQTGTSGTNWNLSGSTLTVTGTANIQSVVIETALNSGDLTIQGSSTAFVVNVEQAISSTTVGSDLTIGSVGNTGTVTVGANITLAGGLTLRGGYVNVNGNLTSSAVGDIFLKGIATNNPSVMLQSGKTITKSGGTGTLTFQGHSRVTNSGTITTTGTGLLNVVLWSDFDNSNNDGGVSHFGTISTNGGHVWLGGSNSNGGSYTWNNLTVGDGPSIGSANYNANGMDLRGDITTFGGDLLAWANTGTGAGISGIVTSGGNEVNVGNGDIVLITPYVLGTGLSIFFRQSGGTFTLVPNNGAFPNSLNWNPYAEVYGSMSGLNFTGDFNYLWIENPTLLKSLTIGYYDGMSSGGSPVLLTNSSNITMATAMSIAGPVSIYGGDISISQNITSTLLGADVLLQATGAINLASSKIVQTSNGDITFKACSGGLASSASSPVYLNSSSQLLSNGGNITLGGGYSGTEGNFYAASNITNGGYALRMDASTIINAAGGNIKLYGRNVTSYGDGVYLSSVTISTIGSGTIGIYGESFGGQNATPVNFGGITFENNASTIQTVNGNLVLKALLTNTQSAATSALNFYRSGGVTGQTNHIQILSNTGNIEITADRGTTNAGGIDHFSWGNVYFGSPSNNSFTATGNITLSFSKILSAFNNGFKVKTTGNVIYQPIATAFDAAQTFPVNSLHVLAESASSLTIGKPGNTADITISSAQSIAGDIDIYAGTLTLNSNLATTNNGDITINSNNAIAGLTAQRNVTAAGLFSYIPQGISFGAAVTYPITNLNLTSAGLLIGKTTNTTDVTFGTAATIAGPITVYGGNININQNLISSASSQVILCKATGNILTASGKTVQTNGGDIIYWADSDNNNSGGIRVDDNVTIDSRTNTDRTNATHTTGGGKIIFAGGLDDGGTSAGTSSLMSGLSSNDGIPDGYAVNSGSAATQSGIVLGTSTSGTGHNCGISVLSGGGDIRFHALATNNTSAVNSGPTGLLFFEGYSINGGTTGNITLLGNSNLTAGSWAIGMDLAAWRTSTASANGNTTAVNGNINIIGRAGGGTSGNIAMAIDGDANRHVFTTTGSGTISLDGLATGTAQTDMRLTNVDLLSTSGAITLTTRGNSGISVGGYAIGNGLFLGQKTGTLVTSSSSNISLVTNNLSTSSKPLTVNGTGQFVIEPFSTSFISGLTLNSTQTLATTLSGLRLGKLNNAANITIGAATSINGPITLHGGTLALNSALTTTNTTTGNLSLNGTTLSGSSTLTVANGRTLTMNLSSNTNYAGLISGTSLNFVKDGAGTLTLPTPTAFSFAAMTISGGAYTLNANQQLTLTGALTNNGTFTMKDGATFVQATSGTSIDGTGTYTVEKALASNSSTWSTTSGRFWYMGVPMVNVARSSYGTPGTTTNRVWSYSEATKSYTELSDGSALLSAGTGYVHRRSTDGTLTFSATGANGLYGSDYSVSGLTKTAGYTSGVNLVSNPYMGFLDWDAVYNASTNIDPTFYIRSNNTTGNNINALISYNGSTSQFVSNESSVSNTSNFRYIAPMQSIWVKVGAAASTGTVNMSRSMLSHQTGNTLKSSTVFPTLARVNLVDGNLFDQLLVYMNSDMSNEVDQYDSEKLPVSGTVQVYTMASNKKLVMNGLKNNKKKVSVPLYLELPASKSYTLQLSEYVLEDGLILLEDKQEGTMQDFTLLENYTFYANSGQLSNRFVLHFILPNAELTTQGPSNNWVGPETSYTDGGNVAITNDDRGNIEITVDQAEEQKVEGNVSVTDMNGKEVYKGQLDGITTAVSLNVPAGIYYLTVQSGSLFEKKKVFIQE